MPSPPAPTPPPIAAIPTSSLDAATDLTTMDMSSVTERIGFLKELGLDYGWGPTALMEWVLEHVHVYAGTPWWVSITLTALLFRAALFRLFLGAADASARSAAITHVTKPITDRMSECSRASDTAGVLRARQELQQIKKRAGIRTVAVFGPFIQIPLGYGAFRLLRGMATLPVPGLSDGGMLWLHNLTVSDPLYLLPTATAGFLYVVLRLGGETGAMVVSPETQRFQALLVYILPAITFIFMSAMPGALQLWFFITSLLSFGQSTLFRTPSFRAWAGIAPLPRPSAASAAGGSAPSAPRYAGTMTLADRYQAPVAPTRPAPSTMVPVKAVKPPGRVKGVVDGAVKEFRGMSNEMKKTVEKYTGSTADGSRKRSKQELEQAKTYDARRKKEIAQQQWAEAEAKRERWAQRKAAQAHQEPR
ncbi:MAG: Mitochondrial inner membrane protein oxa1 [Thelocarpon superellum]|nr:MAG: Mitochondrial inner membrane protein oxa1 [Thelocarpon superellum]